MRLKFKYNFKLELELGFVMRCQNTFGIESTSKAFGKKKPPKTKKNLELKFGFDFKLGFKLGFVMHRLIILGVNNSLAAIATKKKKKLELNLGSKFKPELELRFFILHQSLETLVVGKKGKNLSSTLGLKFLGLSCIVELFLASTIVWQQLQLKQKQKKLELNLGSKFKPKLELRFFILHQSLETLVVWKKGKNLSSTLGLKWDPSLSSNSS